MPDSSTVCATGGPGGRVPGAIGLVVREMGAVGQLSVDHADPHPVDGVGPVGARRPRRPPAGAGPDLPRRQRRPARADPPLVGVAGPAARAPVRAAPGGFHRAHRHRAPGLLPRGAHASRQAGRAHLRRRLRRLPARGAARARRRGIPVDALRELGPAARRAVDGRTARPDARLEPARRGRAGPASRSGRTATPTASSTRAVAPQRRPGRSHTPGSGCATSSACPSTPSPTPSATRTGTSARRSRPRATSPRAG